MSLLIFQKSHTVAYAKAFHTIECAKHKRDISISVQLQRYKNKSKTQNKFIYFCFAKCKTPYLKVTFSFDNAKHPSQI